jgi:hypothetical protein
MPLLVAPSRLLYSFLGCACCVSLDELSYVWLFVGQGLIMMVHRCPLLPSTQ